MTTPFHGCAFILIVLVLPVQTSHHASNAAHFRGTFKILHAIRSCFLISGNDVDHGLYIVTD